MNINAMLSRKLILSVFLFFAATMAMARGMITETQWQWVVMATAVSYVAGATLQANRDMSSVKSIRLWGERLKALFSREYLVAMGTVVVTTALLFQRHISGDVWFAVSTAIAGSYNIVNALSKSEH